MMLVAVFSTIDPRVAIGSLEEVGTDCVASDHESLERSNRGCRFLLVCTLGISVAITMQTAVLVPATTVSIQEVGSREIFYAEAISSVRRVETRVACEFAQHEIPWLEFRQPASYLTCCVHAQVSIDSGLRVASPPHILRALHTPLPH